MTIAEMNIACALNHIETLRKHGAQVTGPDGQRTELNSFFYDTAKDECLSLIHICGNNQPLVVDGEAKPVTLKIRCGKEGGGKGALMQNDKSATIATNNDQTPVSYTHLKVQVALISPASAGHGLNIQKGGHILIWFSLIWSLEMYQQTNARPVSYTHLDVYKRQGEG